MRRCLIIESLPYHWEVLVAWVHMLKDLGIDAEIAVGETSGHRETVALLGLEPGKVHDVRNLGSLPPARFDFVLLNTLVHDGYFFSQAPVPRPDLELLDRLQLPSVCVIHEPVQWVEKLVVHSFIESRDGSEKIINLLADGSSVRENGFWSAERWTIDGDKLMLPCDGALLEFRSSDRGQTYRCVDDPGILLRTRVTPVEDLHGHLGRKQHAVITLTAGGAAKLGEVYTGVEWILPFKIDERHPARSDGPIAFAGTIDYDRKAIPSLLAAAGSLEPGERILVIGGSRSADFENDRFVKTFRRQIAELGIGEKFLFTGYLPYDQFIEKIKRCRFIIPLVDDYVDSGAYLVKLPAAVPLSLGLGVPMIMSKTVSGKFDVDALISYPGQDLAGGLDACRRMTSENYAQMLQTLDDTAKRIYAGNLQKLGAIIDRITGPGSGKLKEPATKSTSC
ncbi:MAG TPA: hypothetical protein VFU15_03440 [Bacteroidia bacterium]|nr:hypothetical protein [Bacteroidia bacterium]